MIFCQFLNSAEELFYLLVILLAITTLFCYDSFVINQNDSLDVYHMDRDIRTATKGMTPRERKAFLKDYIGWKDGPSEDGASFLPVNEDEPPF